ncbi:adenylyltransferase/cytidyltransferase family protein [Paenibacillus sp. Mc5Re-14]|uniref:adenylyltransferase/cytidyltransferase family protein n=1 Tax=Paenibacillus sp. Mc5Re-14 TaxID=1030529 RepID=UPI000B8605BB|nr:adenylyltransferase/cytidyltransferase family protein [Paenibacillus sp. Mc5Re-14]
MNLRKYKFGFVIGRFQMLHAGHEHLINTALAQCENLLILVGSSQESKTFRNPFDAFTRILMLKEIYGDNPNVYIAHIADLTNENDHSHDWGRYLLNEVNDWAEICDIKEPLDAMFYGNDEEREDWFDPKDIEGIAQIKLDRADILISGTTMRSYLAWNNFTLWSKFANQKLHSYFETLRQKLFEVGKDDDEETVKDWRRSRGN